MTNNKDFTYATGMVNPKTTALFFDKLWVYPTLISPDLIPQEVCLDDLLEHDVYMRAATRNSPIYASELARTQNLERDQAKNEEVHRYLSLMRELKRLEDKPPDLLSSNQFFDFFSPHQPKSVKQRNVAIRTIVKSYEKRGISVTPVYFHNSDYNQITQKETTSLVTCFDMLPTILESKLSWEQVIEFRHDKKSREKLNRLRRWFSTDLLEMNTAEIKSILGKKLDDYQWALKKHGIETIIGGMTTVIPVIVSPSIIQLLNASQLETTLGGLALASGATAWITSKMVERMEIARSEIAYIYDIQKIAK